MDVRTTTAPALETDADTIVVGLIDGEGIPHDLPDGHLGAVVSRGEAAPRFRRLAVTHAGGRRIILVGLGERQRLDAERARVAAADVHARAHDLGCRTLCWEVPHHVDDAIVRGLVEGTVLHAYRFDRYRPAEDDRAVGTLLLSAHHDIAAPARTAAVVTAAQNRARDLANTPANDLPPAALADYAARTADRLPALDVTVLDEEQIIAAGMGAFAAVAQGSAQPARLIELRYEGPGADGPWLGLVGKAVTFDSGGLSLKSPASMHEMKFDMSGGAAVIETIAALAELEAPVRVLGVVGATENMPDGRAVKPGDIVRAADGTTIEINNTDAEGRLVLADCLRYARDHGAEELIDVATLTGAIVVALGSTYAGLFANDDALAVRLEAAGVGSGELVWRLPLHEHYAGMVKGRFAQLTNRTERREAASITAAEFLHHFAGETPWAHLDIAGMANGVRRTYFPDRNATGFGVRLLVELATSA
jgi:leucyl aminopeptidase